MNEAIKQILVDFAEYVVYGENNIKKKYEAQKLEEAKPKKSIENIYKKFANMQNTTYWGYNRAEEYYKQAKLIEKLEDNFTNPKRPFRDNHYYYSDGSYPRFNLNDFRLYITWRTNVLKGNVKQTNDIFPKLYINELLNKLHCKNEQEALEKMLAFWEVYREFDSTLDYKMRQAIKEFYLIHEQEQPFEEIQKRFPCKIQGTTKEIIEIKNGNYQNKVKWINNVSNYKIGNSKFLETPYGYMLEECLEQVLNRMHQELNKIHVSLQKILVKKQTNLGYAAEPLSNFCVYIPEQKEVKVQISELEIYSYKKHTWKREAYVANEEYKSFVTYLVKNMECYIRKYVGFRPLKKMEKTEIIKYCCSYYYTPQQEHMLRKLYALDLDNFLKETVMEYLKNCNVPKDICKLVNKKKVEPIVEEEPVKIEFNVDSFANIRKKAEETQKSLIIEEVEETLPEAVKPIVEVPAKEIVVAKPVVIKEENFEKKYDNIYMQFVKSLEAGEREIIKQYIDKGNVKQTIEKIATKTTIMPEMLISKINDKALESIGDTIIDSSMESIYEEYEAEIKQVL